MLRGLVHLENRRPPLFMGFVAAVLLVGAATLLGIGVFSGPHQLADVAMLYVLAIVLVSLRWRLLPSLLASVLSMGALDYCFIPPARTFAMHDITHVATFAVLFLVSIVISSLTQRVRDESEATHEAKRIVEREKLRNSLLSSVSHDLRTPLAIITGTASALLDARVEPALRSELTRTVLTEAERLNRLVRNLLDMTRLDAGAVEPNKEWQAIEETVGAALARVDLGDRPVTTELAADLPLVAYDPILLQQVLVNLLENAAKYTPAGTAITITARALEDAIEVAVADRGPGLPAGEEQRIFDKFYRAEKGRGGGVGLGLTICEGVIVAHRGTISAQNRPGGGAAFRFTLPIEGAPPSIDEEPHA